MANLTHEIIVNILSRLTVKDLLRYRSVSKVWCSLIDGPDFIKAHLNWSRETNSNHGVVLSGHVLYWVNSETLNSAVRLDPPLDSGGEEIDVLGSCNGLLALTNQNGDMAFWNPSTKRYRLLPMSDREFPFDSCLHKTVMVGFGYDPVHDDHKLLRKMKFFGRHVDAGRSETQIRVYSLKAKTWKRVTNFPNDLLFSYGCGVFLCNLLHWGVTRKSESKSGMSVSILAFDLATEDYNWVSVPDYEDDKICIIKLVELGGRLCIARNFNSDDYSAADLVEIWVMKEYGIKESWTKLFSVVPSYVTGQFGYLIPVAYLESRDMVLLNQDGEKFLLYDMKRKRVKSVRFSGSPRSFVTSTFCWRSLVGVDGSFGEIKAVKQAGDENGSKKRKEKQQPSRKNRDDFLSHGFKLVL